MNYNPWPELPYPVFKTTQYLLHMTTQAMGKLKLKTPFEPHWGNVALWVTSRGLTTGPIDYEAGIFSVDMDLIQHEINCHASWGATSKFKLTSTSVAQLTQMLFQALRSMDITMSVNSMPQEIPNPIPFEQDTETRLYHPELANAWWRILVSSQRILQRYHARFTGTTPPVGLMWGTFDLRDARYQGIPVPTTGANADYIRRNAMDVAQVEAGWWSGNEQYPRPAYFSFIYPQPQGIEKFQPKPSAAKWEKSLGEFILDYDVIRQSKNPEVDLLAFFESTYQAEAERAGWDPKLIGKGVPV